MPSTFGWVDFKEDDRQKMLDVGHLFREQDTRDKPALDRTPPRDMIPKLLTFTKGISPEFDEAVQKVPPCLDWQDEEQALDNLGQGWIGEEAVALALYCFLRYPNDYKKIVLRGANTNGDSDSIACIAGGISGARLGAEAIPKEWLIPIEKADQLAVPAEQLRLKKEECDGE